ncbi:hypothetical protein GCM10007423_40030 [Dyadobacter endophyticus]|uniref:Uncharacterized protein n=1 Tax=Dyadobacter endophyticus TaxID=1749036 RepID=A0ABQ1YZ35_9BACT|nr:hypothetical protein GCM10007423_40030 [Dyadobacter endophyticus]
MANRFKEAQADQDYKRNRTATICDNCLHLELSQTPGKDNQSPTPRFKCGIGHFFVRMTHTCRVFEEKPVETT